MGLGGVIRPKTQTTDRRWHLSRITHLDAIETLQRIVALYGRDGVYIITTAFFQEKVLECICKTLEIPRRTGIKEENIIICDPGGHRGKPEVVAELGITDFIDDNLSNLQRIAITQKKEDPHQSRPLVDRGILIWLQCGKEPDPDGDRWGAQRNPGYRGVTASDWKSVRRILEEQARDEIMNDPLL